MKPFCDDGRDTHCSCPTGPRVPVELALRIEPTVRTDKTAIWVPSAYVESVNHIVAERTPHQNGMRGAAWGVRLIHRPREREAGKSRYGDRSISDWLVVVILVAAVAATKYVAGNRRREHKRIW